MGALILSMHGEPTDRTLIRRIEGNKDRDAALGLYLKYSERLLVSTERSISDALSPRVDAEDVVQSVFRTFFRRAAEGQYEVPHGEDLWKLLLVISLNKVRSLGKYHRAAKRNIGISVSLSHEKVESPVSPDEFSRQVLELSISELVSKLPPSAQNIVELRIGGYEVSQISKRTKRSKRTVERVLQHFREELLRISEVG